jgi:hypothetical protein
MADFLSFNEGRAQLATAGLPATCTFALSTKDCNTHVVTDAYASFGEITGTGYARQTEARPSPTSANPSAIVFAAKTFATSSATDWPASVKSCVLVDATNSKLICAWNLVAGGTARAMNAANTTESFTPTLNVA